jgi:hypothetical protein
MLKVSRIFFFVALFMSVFAPLASTQAQEVCKVTDPTGTPLNVRSEPNGKVVNSLRNGREVYIHQTAYDNKARPWVRVGGYYQGKYRIWGWVLREFISCYTP